jgi:hypothetical protein
LESNIGCDAFILQQDGNKPKIQEESSERIKETAIAKSFADGEAQRKGGSRPMKGLADKCETSRNDSAREG